MGQMERYKRLIKFDTAVVILFIEIGLYCLSWTHYHNRVITMPFWCRGDWFMTGLYDTMLFIFHNFYGGLKIGFLRKNNIIYSQLLAILATNVFGYLLLALVERHWYVPLSFVVLIAADMVLVFFWVGIFQWTYNLLFPSRQLLLICGKRLAIHVFEKANSRDDKHVLTAVIRIDGGIERIVQEVLKYGGVIIDDLGSHDRNLIFKCCYEMDERVYMIPKISDMLIWSPDELKLFDIMLLLSRNDGLQADQLFCKRALDIPSVGALFILSPPLFLLLAIAIRLEDRGPVFYKQCCLTRDGKTFDILKFRTMRASAEADGVACLTAQVDDRIMRVGKVLRVTRLGKPPQVLNILKGDTSMVGPCPKRPEITVEHKREVLEFDYRLKVKASLMGCAQIHGVYNTTPYDKLKLGLIYIRNYLIFLDLKLIFMTPKILFMKEKTEGVADGQVTTVQQTGDSSGEFKF